MYLFVYACMYICVFLYVYVCLCVFVFSVVQCTLITFFYSNDIHYTDPIFVLIFNCFMLYIARNYNFSVIFRLLLSCSRSISPSCLYRRRSLQIVWSCLPLFVVRVHTVTILMTGNGDNLAKYEGSHCQFTVDI